MKNPMPEMNMILYWKRVILLSSSAAKVPGPVAGTAVMRRVSGTSRLRGRN